MRIKVIPIAAAVVVATAAAAQAREHGASASAAKLSVRAAVLTKTSAMSWTGDALSPQLGSGRLTVTGPVAFRPTGVSRSVLRFRATFKRGWLSGCVHNAILLRPGNRYVWDGPGQVTATSASLRRYRGVKVRDGGMTPAADLTHARPFEFGTGAPGTRC
jgi:hypothetical protein